MSQKRNGTRVQKGFTLVELMVVIVILGLLATVVAPEVIGRLMTSQEETARLSVSEIDKAIKMYYVDHRKIPEMDDLIQEDERTGRAYLEGFTEAPVDPWGNPFEIRRGDKPNTWEVLCYGPDEVADTEDDISSKTLKDKKKRDS